MTRATLRRGTVAAIAGIAVFAWLLLRGGGPVPEPARPPARPGGAAAEAPAPAPRVSAGPTTPAEPPVPGPVAAEGATGVAAPQPPRRRVVIEGRVVGLDDEPVADATVALVLLDAPFDVVVAQGAFIADPHPDGSERILDSLGEEARSGDDGSFRIETPPRARAGLIAWGGGHANTLVEPFSLEQDVKGLVLRLEPAVALSGRVMETGPPDPDRPPGPIAGALVSLVRRTPDLLRIRLRTERTDAEGRFRAWGWAPGEYEVSAWKPGFVETRWQRVTLPLDGLELRLVPARDAAAAGRVFLPGGEPAAGVPVRAEVAAGGEWAQAWRTGTTGPDGRYRIEGLAVSTTAARDALRVEADGGERGRGRVVLQAWSGETEANVDLTPAPGAVLRLRVLDGSRGSGRPPVRGVRLRARGSIAQAGAPLHALEFERVGTTGADGVVVFRGLPPKHVLVGPADDEWGWEVERGGTVRVEDAPDEGPWEREIEAFPRGRIAGVVLGPSGEPVAGARVEIPQNPGQRLAPAAALAGADGRFLVPAVSAQVPLHLRATAAGFAAGHSPQIAVVPGSTAEGVVLALPAAFAVLSGLVVDEAGRPRAEVRVEARAGTPGAAAGAGRTWTGPTGRYRMEVPAGGSWTLRAEQPGLASGEMGPIVAGEPVPDLVLRPAEGAK